MERNAAQEQASQSTQQASLNPTAATFDIKFAMGLSTLESTDPAKLDEFLAEATFYKETVGDEEKYIKFIVSCKIKGAAKQRFGEAVPENWQRFIQACRRKICAEK